MHRSPIGIGRARSIAFASIFVLFLSAAPSATAEPGDYVLTPDSSVDLAFRNNLSLASEEIDLAAKKRKVDTSWNVFIPEASASGTLSRWNLERSVDVPSLTPPYRTSYDLPQWSASGQLSVQLALNAALFEGIRSVKLDYEAGRISAEQARLRLERDVRKTYYSILLIGENISLMEENLATAERRVLQAEDNYRSGLVPELTVLQAKVAAENLKPALEELRNGYDASLAGFAQTLGLSRGAKLTLERVDLPGFVTLDAEALVSSAVANRVELRGLRKSLDLLESAKKLTFYQRYTPTLVLGWTYDPTFQGDPMKDSWFSEDWKQSSGMFRATLSFNLDGLLPFTSKGQKEVEAQENIRKLQNTLEQTVRGTETEIDTTVRKLDKSRRTVEALALNVSLADRAYQLTDEAYRAGAKDLLEVQNAELELRKARLEVLKERFNYVSGILDLEYAAGLPFGSLGGKK